MNERQLKRLIVEELKKVLKEDNAYAQQIRKELIQRWTSMQPNNMVGTLRDVPNFVRNVDQNLVNKAIAAAEAMSPAHDNLGTLINAILDDIKVKSNTGS